jgi:putative transposase
VDFVKEWVARFECVRVKDILGTLNLHSAKYSEWKGRYSEPNLHNGHIPRDSWLLPEEKKAIVDFYLDHSLDGYRRCTYMMIDQDIVCCSPSTVYRVLSDARAMRRWNRSKPSRKGTGFVQPLKAHKHWHTDISYVNISGTFYYLISILDGFSRYMVHWDIRKSMTELDVQLILQKAKELFPEARPRIISDNGKQFTCRDFKELVRSHGMTHVRTSPYYPQSNGKLERFHKTIKNECIRPGSPLTQEDAKRLVRKYVNHYNKERLHSAINYVTPQDKLDGKAEAICEERNRKLEEARKNRKKADRKIA